MLEDAMRRDATRDEISDCGIVPLTCEGARLLFLHSAQ